MTAETDAQRRQTKAFIDAEPTDIRLQRAELTPNGAGGTRIGAASPLPPQTVRLLIPTITSGQGERQLLDGEAVAIDYVLLGEWDADVKRGDWFYLNGVKYEIVSTRPTSDYEIKAEVTNRG